MNRICFSKWTTFWPIDSSRTSVLEAVRGFDRVRVELLIELTQGDILNTDTICCRVPQNRTPSWRFIPRQRHVSVFPTATGSAWKHPTDAPNSGQDFSTALLPMWSTPSMPGGIRRLLLRNTDGENHASIFYTAIPISTPIPARNRSSAISADSLRQCKLPPSVAKRWRKHLFATLG